MRAIRIAVVVMLLVLGLGSSAVATHGGSAVYRMNVTTMTISEGAGEVWAQIVGEGGIGPPYDHCVDLKIVTNSASDADLASPGFNFCDAMYVGTPMYVKVAEIVDDGSGEANETFTIQLDNPTGGAEIGSPSETVVTIEDDDGGASSTSWSLSPDPATVNEGDGPITLQASVTNGTPSSTQCTPLEIQEGSATTSDYSAPATEACVPVDASGSGTAAIPIATLVDDAADEGAEYFTVLVKGPGGAVVASDSVTILDNDGGDAGGGGAPGGGLPGAFRFAQSSYSIGENGILLNVIVERVGGSSGRADVEVDLSPGTATAAADYESGFIRLSFDDGQTSETVPINILNDTETESGETFILTLTSPRDGTTLADPYVSTVTILDDESGTSPTLPARGIDLFRQGAATPYLGDQIIVYGSISDVGGTPADCLAGQTVYIYRDIHGGDPAYENVGSAVTDAQGAFSTDTPVLGSANYYAFIPADATCGAAVSTDLVVNARSDRKLVLTASPKRFKGVQRVVFTAKLTPCVRGDLVILELKDGRRFKEVARGGVSSACKITFKKKIRKTSVFRAKSPPISLFQTVTSRLVKVTRTG